MGFFALLLANQVTKPASNRYRIIGDSKSRSSSSGDLPLRHRPPRFRADLDGASQNQQRSASTPEEIPEHPHFQAAPVRRSLCVRRATVPAASPVLPECQWLDRSRSSRTAWLFGGLKKLRGCLTDPDRPAPKRCVPTHLRHRLALLHSRNSRCQPRFASSARNLLARDPSRESCTLRVPTGLALPFSH